MFGAETIEIAIGLVFFYLLLSLLVTTINELISGLLDFRGRYLSNAVGKMLGETYRKEFYDHPLLAIDNLGKQSLWTKVFGNRAPSYLRSTSFSQIVTQIVSRELQTKRQTALRLLSKHAKPESLLALTPIETGAADETRLETSSPASLTKQIENQLARMSLDKVNELIWNLQTSSIDGNEAKTPEAIETSPTISHGDAADAHWGDMAGTIAGMGFSDETKSVILGLAKSAQGDINVFKQKLEEWFDSSMERLTGFYVRYMKVITLIVAMVIAIAINADTFAVVLKLSHDSSARKQLVNSATQYVKDMGPVFEGDTGFVKIALPKSSNAVSTASTSLPASSTSAHADSTHIADVAKDSILPKKGTAVTKSDSLTPGDSMLVSKIQYLALRADTLINEDIAYASQALGLGWNKLNSPYNPAYCACKCKLWCVLKKIGGWMITAIAISLGAPFWFDLLKKLVSIRAAGVNPDEASKKGKKKAVG